MMRIPEYRDKMLRKLPRVYGVYVLCDLDDIPVYVGQSFGGKDDHIASRVRRHLTSARSDVIANRLIDIWEIAYVRAYVCDQSDKEETIRLERRLFHEFDSSFSLMNGAQMRKPDVRVIVPDPLVVQVLPDEELARRRQVEFRFPRQLGHIAQMVDWLLEVAKNRGSNSKAPMIRRALRAHFERLQRYHEELQATGIAK